MGTRRRATELAGYAGESNRDGGGNKQTTRQSVPFFRLFIADGKQLVESQRMTNTVGYNRRTTAMLVANHQG